VGGALFRHFHGRGVFQTQFGLVAGGGGGFGPEKRLFPKIFLSQLLPPIRFLLKKKKTQGKPFRRGVVGAWGEQVFRIRKNPGGELFNFFPTGAVFFPT